MKDENEIILAWKIWHLISQLNDLIWDYYEDEFIQHHLQETNVQYRGSLTDYMSLDDPDF
jgi:DNA polymerase IIIc chi subunit